MKPVEERRESFLSLGVNARRRLVEHEQLGLCREGLGDESALLLSAREPRKGSAGDCAEAHTGDRLVDLLPVLSSGSAKQADTWQPPGRDDLSHRGGSAHIELRPLGQVADRLAPGELDRRLAEEQRLTGVRTLEAEDEPQQRRLPAAVGPRDRDELPSLDGQVDVGEHGRPLAVRERQRSGLDCYRHPRAFRSAPRFSRMTEK